jgi:hypothetical protein
MQPTIYAAFNSAADAEKATGALMDHGIKPEQISLIMSEEAQKRAQEESLNYTHRQIVAPIHSASNTLDPLGNNQRDTPITIEPANLHDRDLGPGQELLADDLNPAQNDYPRSGTGGSWSLSSAPPEAQRDFNKGLESDNYNADYKNDVERENDLQYQKDRAETIAGEPDEGLDINRPVAADSERDLDRTVGPAAYDAESAGKKGITTTTIEDAADAAKKGALWGLGVGALAAVAALAVPGFGIILGGGALAAASGALAASAGAGAVAGGVVGYLKDQGVPAHDIPHYQKAVESGGAILAVQVDESARGPIEELLRKYGAHATNDYGYAA